MSCSFVFVVGFELSGIGKGTIASSLGLLLKGYGIQTSALKIDPYLNIDPGTISPHEHGEVYVLNDGSETDLDLGNYERFLGIDLMKENNMTTGQVYREVIQREREGKYLGKTVQIVPHITDHIEERILNVAKIPVNGKLPEVVIVELGGTVGDMESEPFLYAISQFERRTKSNVCVIGIGLLINNNGELKTKPLQHAVQNLRRHSISPDVLCVRCDIKHDEFPNDLRKKIANSCNMNDDAIIVSGKVRTIYDVPQMLRDQMMHEQVCRKLGLLWHGTLTPSFDNYSKILSHFDKRLNVNSQMKTVNVAIVAKYTGTPDTYLSLIRALEHAAFASDIRLNYEFIDAEELEGDNPPNLTTKYDRILVPGGFGSRGIEGKMAAIRQARSSKIPYFGICLGMQLFVVDHCRTVLGWKDANSTEFNPNTAYPVVQHLSVYGDNIVKQLGGTMRLGAYDAVIQTGTLAYQAYGSGEISERHRHRYEVSPFYIDNGNGAHGLKISAWSNQKIPEMVENCYETGVKDWWAVACQFHPEFISRNDKAHPLFVAFLKA